MKSWMKTVILILILYAILVYFCAGRCNNIKNNNSSSSGGGDNDNSNLFTPGPTCDTYYYVGKDLRVCPAGREFNCRLQACVPIAAYDGCYANSVTKYTNLYARFEATKKERRQDCF
uniref:Uncharacterized protein n=1 Tax=Spodoptera exigua multiple nucleopolyhedrovirus TaxID=10454 RepID=A0A6N0C1Q8_9ABAC|nr:hypothetical protein [Spodoptera exigua multiple nucleopolyhedrovirus]